MRVRATVLLPVVALVTLLTTQTEAATKLQAYQLYTDVFVTSGYNKYVRPTDNTSEPTMIYLTFKLVSLIDLDEKAQAMKTNARMEMDWDDWILSWNVSEYGNQEYIFTAQENVWLPDIMVDNSVVKQGQIGFDDLPIRVQYDGIVIWTPNLLLTTSCDIEVTYYPFDQQLCYIDFATQISKYAEVDINIDQTLAMDTSDYSQDGTWELISYSAKNLDNDGNKSKIRFSLILKRRTTFYVINIVLPVLFLSMTAALVFALPSDSGEKMGTSITVLLAYAVYLTIVSAYLPNTSLQTSILALYLTILLGITAFSVVVSVFVLRIYFKPDTDKVGSKITKLTLFLQTIMFMKKHQGQRLPKEGSGNSSSVKKNAVAPENGTIKELEPSGASLAGPYEDDENRGSRPESLRQNSTVSDPPYYEEPMNWHTVASTIDWMCFILFSSAVLVTTLVCMVVLVVGGKNNAPTLD